MPLLTAARWRPLAGPPVPELIVCKLLMPNLLYKKKIILFCIKVGTTCKVYFIYWEIILNNFFKYCWINLGKIPCLLHVSSATNNHGRRVSTLQRCSWPQHLFLMCLNSHLKSLQVMVRLAVVFLCSPQQITGFRQSKVSCCSSSDLLMCVLWCSLWRWTEQMAFQGAAAGGAVLLVLHRGCWELKHTRSCSIALKEACNLLFGRSWASILGKTRWKKQHRALSLFPYRKGEGEHATHCQKQVGGPFGFPLSPPEPTQPRLP